MHTRGQLIEAVGSGDLLGLGICETRLPEQFCATLATRVATTHYRSLLTLCFYLVYNYSQSTCVGISSSWLDQGV